jgi:hypothetical protein
MGPLNGALFRCEVCCAKNNAEPKVLNNIAARC